MENEEDYRIGVVLLGSGMQESSQIGGGRRRRVRRCQRCERPKKAHLSTGCAFNHQQKRFFRDGNRRQCPKEKARFGFARLHAQGCTCIDAKRLTKGAKVFLGGGRERRRWRMRGQQVGLMINIADLRTPICFCHVQTLIGNGQKVFRSCRFIGNSGNTDTQTDTQRGCPRNRGCLKMGKQTLCQLKRILSGALRQHQHQFIAAIAKQEIALTDMTANCRHHDTQDIIAALVPKRIVDALEIIYVNEQEATRCICQRVGHKMLQYREQPITLIRSGKPILG